MKLEVVKSCGATLYLRAEDVGVVKVDERGGWGNNICRCIILF